MAIAFDAAASTGTFDATSPMPWTHTPVGTPRGILVLIASNANTNTVTGCTYGGVGMSQLRYVNVGGSAGEVYAYFLGSGIPAGAQTVNVTFSGGQDHTGSSISLTAGDDVQVEHHLGLTGTGTANPSITLTTSITTYTAGVLYSTQNPAPDGNHSQILEISHSGAFHNHMRRNANVGAGNPVVSWTAAAGDVAAIAVALKEKPSPERTAGYIVGLARRVRWALTGRSVFVPDPVGYQRRASGILVPG